LVRGVNNLAAVCFAGTKWMLARLLGATIKTESKKGGAHGAWNTALAAGVPIPIIILIALLYH
jgi:hypothetical protein